MKKFISIGIFLISVGGVAIMGSPTVYAAQNTVSPTPAATQNGGSEWDNNTPIPSLNSGSGFVPLAPIPGLTEGTVADSSGLATFLQNLYKYLIGLAAIIAVIEIIRGGIEISTQDSVSKQGAGREHITQAILGLVLVLAPVLVFSIINPSILNLSINIQNLKTASTPPNTGLPQGDGGYLTPKGQLAACANNNCTKEKAACDAQNVPSAGVIAESLIVCVTSGNIDSKSSPGIDAGSNCPSPETKSVECITTVTVIPGG